MPDKNKILLLLEKYSRKETTIAEENELFEIVNQAHDNDIQNELAEIFEEIEPVSLPAGIKEKILANIFDGEATGSHAVPPVKKYRVFSIWKVAIAASVILMLGACMYFLFFGRRGKMEMAKTPEPAFNDVKAPDNRAVIILGNGEKVFLDSVGKGTFTTQGNVSVVKTADDKIVYDQKAGDAEQALQYNTMFNPRGSKVQLLTLSDGTRVWLNSESSIKYPVVFTGNERKVEVAGEVYFEVAKNAAMPFKVKKPNNDAEIQVLGTHFNVNAYDDEDAMKVTLLEGSVKVSSMVNGQWSMLKPGEQCIASAHQPFTIDHSPNLEEVMAWKNGIFLMKKTGIGSIMRQIARWYDVEIVYENNVPDGTISGEVPRSFTLSQVAKVLEYSGVHLIIQGKKVIVKE